jgi:hypothetical protein
MSRWKIWLNIPAAAALVFSAACSELPTASVGSTPKLIAPKGPLANYTTPNYHGGMWLYYFHANENSYLRWSFHGYGQESGTTEWLGGNCDSSCPTWLSRSIVRNGAPDDYLTIEVCTDFFGACHSHGSVDVRDWENGLQYLGVKEDGNTFAAFIVKWDSVDYQAAGVDVTGLGSVPSGATLEATASAWDSHHRYIPGLPVSWSSSDTHIATVSAGGGVTGREPGTVTITATVGGVSGSHEVTINNDLGVNIIGETNPKPGSVCRYYAEVFSSYAEPLSYEWRLGWDSESQIMGSGTYFDRQLGSNESARFMLRVRDANGREGWAYLSSESSWSGNDCGR